MLMLFPNLKSVLKKEKQIAYWYKFNMDLIFFLGLQIKICTLGSDFNTYFLRKSQLNIEYFRSWLLIKIMLSSRLFKRHL